MSGQGLLSCSFIDNLHPEIHKLVYWKSPIHSGAVLVTGLSLLLTMEHLSFISVISYTFITLLCCSAGWKVTHDVIGSFKKGTQDSENEKSIFHAWLTSDFIIPQEKIHSFIYNLVEKSSSYLNYLRKIFALENSIETGKFALVMYILTIVGNWFNLLTLVIISFITLFSWPKIYQIYQPEIDNVFKIFQGHYNNLLDKLKKKLPIPNSKKQE